MGIGDGEKGCYAFRSLAEPPPQAGHEVGQAEAIITGSCTHCFEGKETTACWFLERSAIRSTELTLQSGKARLGRRAGRVDLPKYGSSEVRGVLEINFGLGLACSGAYLRLFDVRIWLQGVRRGSRHRLASFRSGAMTRRGLKGLAVGSLVFPNQTYIWIAVAKAQKDWN